MGKENYFRTRINTKQTAKCEYYVDVTTENKSDEARTPEGIAQIHLAYLNAVLQAMRNDGK